MLVIFGKRDISFLTVKNVSNLYCQSVPFRGLLGDLDMRKYLTQNRMNGCLNNGDIRGLNWNLKRSMKNGSIKIYKTF